jgi:hypothetical protein
VSKASDVLRTRGRSRYETLPLLSAESEAPNPQTSSTRRRQKHYGGRVGGQARGTPKFKLQKVRVKTCASHPLAHLPHDASHLARLCLPMAARRAGCKKDRKDQNDGKDAGYDGIRRKTRRLRADKGAKWQGSSRLGKDKSGQMGKLFLRSANWTVGRQTPARGNGNAALCRGVATNSKTPRKTA